MYTDEKIIRQAMLQARMGKADIQTLDDYLESYEFIKTELLARRNWVFIMDILEGNAIRPAKPSVNLGLTYTYSLPSYVLGVKAVNPTISQFRPMGVMEALKYGISLENDGDMLGVAEGNHTFRDGILHSSVEVTEVLVRKNVDASVFTPSFATLLATEFASFLAGAVKEEEILKQSLKRQALDQYIIAANESDVPRDAKTNKILHWLQVNTRGRSY